MLGGCSGLETDRQTDRPQTTASGSHQIPVEQTHTREVETLLGLESTLLAAAMAEPGSLPLESRMRQAPTTDRLVP